MKIIPFYHHYHDPTQDTGVTCIRLNEVFEKERISLLEKPCLCNGLERKLPSIILVHGSREIEDPCYDQIKKYVLKNPKTKFYIFALSLAMYSNDAKTKVQNRLGELPNYTAWVGSNMENCFKEIVDITKKL